MTVPVDTCAGCYEDLLADDRHPLPDGYAKKDADCAHEFHKDCLDQIVDNLLECTGCNPPPAPAAPSAAEPTAGEQFSTGADPAFDAPLAPVVEPSTNAPIASEAELTPTPDAQPVAVAATTAAPPATAPAVDLDEAQKAAALRLQAALDRARNAYRSATAAIAVHTGKGVADAAVRRVVDTEYPGFGAALDACGNTGPWESTAAGMADWPANADTIDSADTASGSYEANAALLESTIAFVRSMAVVGIGDGVRRTLTATGARNVAEMATVGEGYSGHHDHNLRAPLAGWKSIRAEEGFVVIVKWNGTRWDVGATGEHEETSNGYTYKLDAAKLASNFTATLAWRSRSGGYKLG